MIKSGDFAFENLKDINAKGFNIDLTKVSESKTWIEADQCNN